MEFISIKDTVTGETLIVTRQSLDVDYIVIKHGVEHSDLEKVKKASIRKVIRAWMRSRDDNNRQKRSPRT